MTTIETLKKDIENLQFKLNTRPIISCPHIMCDVCARSLKEQEIEYDNYMIELNAKINLLNNLEWNE